MGDDQVGRDSVGCSDSPRRGPHPQLKLSVCHGRTVRRAIAVPAPTEGMIDKRKRQVIGVA